MVTRACSRAIYRAQDPEGLTGFPVGSRILVGRPRYVPVAHPLLPQEECKVMNETLQQLVAKVRGGDSPIGCDAVRR